MFSFLRWRKPSHQRSSLHDSSPSNPDEIFVDFRFTLEPTVSLEDLEVVAFGLNQQGVVRSTRDFVCHANPTGVDEAVRVLLGQSELPTWHQARFVVNLSRVPEAIQHLAFVAMIDTHASWRMRSIHSAGIAVHGAPGRVSLVDGTESQEVVRRGQDIGAGYMHLAQLHRESGQKWTLRPLEVHLEDKTRLGVLNQFGVKQESRCS